MGEAFFKFPRTPHLMAVAGAQLRGDKLVAPAEADVLLRQPATVEEKVDGANLGLSVGPDGRMRAQSRGHYLEHGTGGQFQPLWRWLAARESALAGLLGSSLIAFGEWCYARHTVTYDGLPDWYLLFDVYDCGAGQFWSRVRRDAWATKAGLEVAPFVAAGVFGRASVQKLLGRSKLGSAMAEGLYLRWDEGDWLKARAKIVRQGWVAADDEHWSQRPLEKNRLAGSQVGSVATARKV